MARHEADREDLFAEAVALVARVELAIPESAEPVTAGHRSSGAWSIYLGQEQCYHFDPRGALRRAFVNGTLYRSQGTTLAKLTRVRTPGRIELQRRDLGPAECRAFLARMHERLAALRDALASQSAVRLRQFPPETEVAGRLLLAVERILSAEPQLAPRVGPR